MGAKVLTTKTGVTLQHPGSGMAYSSYGCRYGNCIAFNTERNLKRRMERREMARNGTMPANIKHGRSAASNWGCRCGVCVEALRVSNAEWYDNHYARTGHKLGEDRPNVKLKNLEAQAIHERLKLGEKPSQIAREYGVKPKVIYDLKRGRTWSWLTGRGKV